MRNGCLGGGGGSMACIGYSSRGLMGTLSGVGGAGGKWAGSDWWCAICCRWGGFGSYRVACCLSGTLLEFGIGANTTNWGCLPKPFLEAFRIWFSMFANSGECGFSTADGSEEVLGAAVVVVVDVLDVVLAVVDVVLEDGKLPVEMRLWR